MQVQPFQCQHYHIILSSFLCVCAALPATFSPEHLAIPPAVQDVLRSKQQTWSGQEVEGRMCDGNQDTWATQSLASGGQQWLIAGDSGIRHQKC